MRRPVIKSVSIPANTALSGGVNISDVEMIAIEMPETFTPTTLTFQSKAKGFQAGDGEEDWDNVYDSAGNELTMTVAAGRVVVPTAAHQAALRPLHWLRIRVGTSGTPVNINPGVDIRLICK